MEKRLEHSESVRWYDITIAGKPFNIASRHGEVHIRKVERLLEKTVDEVTDRIQGKSPATIALLSALNLADQLLLMESTSQAFNGRLELMLHRLQIALGESPAESPGAEIRATGSGERRSTHPGNRAPASTGPGNMEPEDEESDTQDTPAVFD